MAAGDADRGGDAACWAGQVCPDCGRIPDAPTGPGDRAAAAATPGPRPDGAACPGCGQPLPSPLTDADYRALAEFRAALRQFLRRSEEAARTAGLTPGQHQLLLAVRGWPGDAPPSVTDLAERLQLQVHSTGELLTRAETAGLVRREPDTDDARRHRIVLTAEGAARLAELAAYHRDQLRGLRRRMLAVLAELDG